jgi:hypothetical protein
MVVGGFRVVTIDCSGELSDDCDAKVCMYNVVVLIYLHAL